jgi:hypothetical protein
MFSRIKRISAVVLLVLLIVFFAGICVNSKVNDTEIGEGISVEELGMHVWPYLHTFAASIAKYPSATERTEIEQFITLL